MVNVDKLKGKLTEKRKTYDECSKAIGVTKNTFNTKMNGPSKFYIEEVNALSKFLELTEMEKVDIFLT